jgi:peptidoglycan/LPS O-acetylase OafA/YrhL
MAGAEFEAEDEDPRAIAARKKASMRSLRGIAGLFVFWILAGCAFQSGPEGSPALKLFGALGICLAAVFLIFYIVVKSREKE